MGINLLIASLLIAGAFQIDPSDAGTISNSLLTAFSTGGTKNIMVEFPSVFSSVMNSPALITSTGPLSTKTTLMIELLKKETKKSQRTFMDKLTELGADKSATPFYISNDISVKNVDLALVKSLAELPGTFIIREQVLVTIPKVLKSVRNFTAKSDDVQWGVKMIEAPAVWEKSNRGEGMIVANIDTGVKGDHEGLKSNYAGKWLDATDEGDSTANDRNSHGTHVMGTICGTTQGIGVAPGAKWIACKGLNQYGSGTEEWLKTCGQWILEQRPHVVSNSWGSRGGDTWYNDVINAWKAAGIVPVFSIGNSGPQCKSTGSPGDQENAFGIGSTNENDTVSKYSSRGTTVDGRMKPDVCAPGEEVYSSVANATDAYDYYSGTSMAAPHATGAVALILGGEGNAELTVDEVISKLESSADHISLSEKDLSCGKPSDGSDYPNNACGKGRLNVHKAMGF